MIAGNAGRLQEYLVVKQIAQYQDGRLEIQEVPIPTAPPGGVLVRTTHSVISIGTEKMKVEQARMNLLQKARARPDQVRKVLDTARALGWRAALEKVRNRLESPSPLGYSAAGIVAAVDSGNTRFAVGDRVACAGAECAFHAEYLALPDLLVAPVPDRVPSWQAAYTTLCAIALQAVRQTEPTLGDRILVMGQGLVGLLVTNLLAANGVRVMAVDLQASRRRFSELAGAEKTVILGPQNLADEVRVWTGGLGVDAAVICTATQSNTPIEQAADALRDRGRLIDVGITKIELPWKIFYEKELDVRFSRSYGPGRYDPNYEWAGNDYPVGYVRWTEQRNFQACLHLMATGTLKLDALTTRRVPFANALQVYNELAASASSDIGVVLEYEASPAGPSPALPTRITADISPGAEGQLPRAIEHLDVIGAGNFTKTMLLPHLKDRIRLRTVVNQTGLSARHVQSKFGFENASTDAATLLQQASAGAVLIGTRHHLHAPLVIAALKNRRHVFVEKPLCLTPAELEEISGLVRAGLGTVQVGFNRRFAPATTVLKQLLQGCPGPKVASYRVLAGRLDPTHWYANYQESGGRILGEACHFLDYFCCLFDSRPVSVQAQATGASEKLPFPDSTAIQVRFADGSSAQLIYHADGDSSFPKETFTLFAAGLSAEIINFQKLSVYHKRKRTDHSFSSKGHAEQMAAWLRFLAAQSLHPLPYAAAEQSMGLTFAALESIRSGRSITIQAQE